MAEETTANILILGIGNVLMGDEGIGARVAQSLLEEQLPPGITCLDGGTGGFQLLGVMESARVVLLVDAVADGKPLGTLDRLIPRFSKDYPPRLTAHDIGLKDMIDALYLMNKIPKIILYTVSIELPKEPGLELSEPLQKAIPDIAKKILQEAHEFLKNGNK